MKCPRSISELTPECRNGHSREGNTTWVYVSGRWKPRCLLCQRDSTARHRGRKRTGEKVKLDAKPFSKWLQEKIEERGVHNAAAETRLPERTLWRLVNQHTAVVHIDTVDRALLYTPTNMQELYPDLFEFEEAVA